MASASRVRPVNTGKSACQLLCMVRCWLVPMVKVLNTLTGLSSSRREASRGRGELYRPSRNFVNV